MAAFRAYQVQYVDRLRQANGLDLARARVASPVVRWLPMPLGSAFALLITHERRHLVQAQRVLAGAGVSATVRLKPDTTLARSGPAEAGHHGLGVWAGGLQSPHGRHNVTRRDAVAVKRARRAQLEDLGDREAPHREALGGNDEQRVAYPLSADVVILDGDQTAFGLARTRSRAPRRPAARCTDRSRGC